MSDLDIYTQSINQIFACLDSLDANLESDYNTNIINNLMEYKELAVTVAGLITEDNSNKDSEAV
ncbi:MAG: hypothetical protein IKO49_03105 [Bacilli bacterium]|nr:hypothetical protein [Bacilli bacterium]